MLRSLIDDLSPAGQLELIRLLWLGHDDAEGRDFITIHEQTERSSEPGDVSYYLSGKEALGRHLRRGLERIGAGSV
jgi:hypothetical protein